MLMSAARRLPGRNQTQQIGLFHETDTAGAGGSENNHPMEDTPETPLLINLPKRQIQV